jgi:hypothetical protein
MRMGVPDRKTAASMAETQPSLRFADELNLKRVQIGVPQQALREQCGHVTPHIDDHVYKYRVLPHLIDDAVHT